MKDQIEVPTTDIAELANRALAKALQPEAVQEIVEKQITETVRSAIKDATRSFSPFGRDLEKKIAEAISLKNLDLPSYNAIIAGMVQQAVEGNMAELIQGRLSKDIDEMLKVAPRSIKLSEIVDEMRKSHEEDGAYGEVITCIVEPQDARDSDFWGPNWKIYLDDGTHYSDRERGYANVEIEIRHGIKEDRAKDNDEIYTGTISYIRESTGVITSKGGQAGFTMSRTYGLAQRLLAMYAAETVIEIDEDEVVIAVGDY